MILVEGMRNDGRQLLSSGMTIAQAEAEGDVAGEVGALMMMAESGIKRELVGRSEEEEQLRRGGTKEAVGVPFEGAANQDLMDVRGEY